mgnify:CR=1 FL=1
MSFLARYNGTCCRCGEPIVPNERIEGLGYNGYRHTGCTAPAATTATLGDNEPKMAEDTQRRIDDQEYALGYAAGTQYCNDVKTYGQELADQWEMDRELAAWNRGDDY